MSPSVLATAESQRAARLLEFPRVLEDVARHCTLERAAAELADVEPIADPEGLQELWAWIAELGRFLETTDLPLGDMPDLVVLLGKERPASGPLGPEELAAVMSAAQGLAVVRVGVQSAQDSLTRTWKDLSSTEDPAPVAKQLQAALEPDGRIKASASARLAGLRRAVVNAHARVRDLARARMAEAIRQGWTTADELVLRGDRHCIPLRSGERGRVPGIVHDRSGTGSTLFVEPMDVVEAGNELAELTLEMEDEERRIVAGLNRYVADHANDLLQLYRRVVHIDTLRARVRWGAACQGRIPRLHLPGTGILGLQGFRHPLLELGLKRSGGGAKLVPLSLELGADDRVLLISGPNAGGKTVALKAVGLAVLMAQSGIPLPAAAEPQLSICDRVLMDLGDEQSIADALSSFSAHLTHLREILRLATSSSLVLLDEIGSGTDPQEGVALARALLEAYAASGCRTLATTHYGQLKVLVQDGGGFRNASMAFDQKRLQPRFELQLDLPGSSHALEIADRLQLPASVLQRAQELVGDERLRLDSLLSELSAQRSRWEKLSDELEDERELLRTRRQEHETAAGELRYRRREILDRAEQEAEGILRNVRRRIERLISEIRSAGGVDEGRALEIARLAREETDLRRQRVSARLRHRDTRRRGHRPAVLVPGSTARHVVLDQVGRIVGVRGNRIVLEISGRRVVARAHQLVAADAPPEEDQQKPLDGAVRVELAESDGPAVTRIDVRGLDADSAWQAVDRALDRCVLSGIRSLELIHGKGTGRLRSTLAERLAADERVRRASVGAQGQADDGMTLVEL